MAEFLFLQNKDWCLNHTNHDILLVEDDPEDVLTIRELVGNKPSLEIVHKKNGLEAMSYLNQYKHKARPQPKEIEANAQKPENIFC